MPVITVRSGGPGDVELDGACCPKLDAGYADTYIDGVRYRVRTVEIRAPDPMSVAVGATYDETIAEIDNLHRRVLVICAVAIGAAAVLGWLLAAFAVRPFRRLAQQTRPIDAGDEAPDIEVRGATRGRRDRRGDEGHAGARLARSRTAPRRHWTSARDFAAPSVARTAHPADGDADQPRGAGHPGDARGATQGSARRRHPDPVPDRGHAVAHWSDWRRAS